MCIYIILYSSISLRSRNRYNLYQQTKVVSRHLRRDNLLRVRKTNEQAAGRENKRRQTLYLAQTQSRKHQLLLCEAVWLRSSGAKLKTSVSSLTGYVWGCAFRIEYPTVLIARINSLSLNWCTGFGIKVLGSFLQVPETSSEIQQPFSGTF